MAKKRGLELGDVPTEPIMRVVHTYLAKLETRYHMDMDIAFGKGGRHGKVVKETIYPEAPMTGFARDAGVEYNYLAKRRWAYKNGKIGVQGTSNGTVGAWTEFDIADKLLCAMHKHWLCDEELAEIYYKVNLGCVECGEYGCGCELAAA